MKILIINELSRLSTKTLRELISTVNVGESADIVHVSKNGERVHGPIFKLEQAKIELPICFKERRKAQWKNEVPRHLKGK